MKEKLIAIMQKSRAYMALNLEVPMRIIDDALSYFADELIKAGVTIQENKNEDK